MPNQVQVGFQQANDGGVINQRGDNFGSTVVTQFNGKYAELARRGQLINFSVAAGAALLLSATTGNHPTIWNPTGSGKVLYLCRLKTSFLSGTTTVSSLLWCVTRNAGSSISATAPVVTFTNVSPQSAAVGGNGVSNMLWAPATCTFTAAPTFFAATGVNLGAAGPTAGAGNFDMDLDGEIALYPGNALSLTCSVTTTTSLWWTSIWGAELPYIG
jgi:hypothetical protein